MLLKYVRVITLMVDNDNFSFLCPDLAALSPARLLRMTYQVTSNQFTCSPVKDVIEENNDAGAKVQCNNNEDINTEASVCGELDEIHG